MVLATARRLSSSSCSQRRSVKPSTRSAPGKAGLVPQSWGYEVVQVRSRTIIPFNAQVAAVISVVALGAGPTAYTWPVQGDANGTGLSRILKAADVKVNPSYGSWTTALPSPPYIPQVWPAGQASPEPVTLLPKVTVVGLGPGRPGLVTAESVAAIENAPVRWLRTSRHPSALAVPGARSFDYLYESAATSKRSTSGIVDALVGSATGEGPIVYAVPGSPGVAERTVELLRADHRVETVVLPGVSFADLAFERLGVDPLAAGARVVDGHRFATQVAGFGGPVAGGAVRFAQVLSEVKLALGSVLDQVAGRRRGRRVTVLKHLGSPDEEVTVVPWDELDRAVVPDHLTSIWVPRLGDPFAAEFVRLEELARALRARCPWDRVQTHQSLTRYLLEESYEALEAIEELGPEGAGYEHLEEELGDVLFQVVFHSVLAAEEGQFALADVARNVHDKLVGRHPHVFGDVEAQDGRRGRTATGSR